MLTNAEIPLGILTAIVGAPFFAYLLSRKSVGVDMILDVNQAGFQYDPVRMIFSDISFSLGEQEELCILGPTGIGKSTLIRCLANLYPLCVGSIRLHDRDIQSLNYRDVARVIGYVPQAHEITSHPGMRRDRSADRT